MFNDSGFWMILGLHRFYRFYRPNQRFLLTFWGQHSPGEVVGVFMFPTKNGEPVFSYEWSFPTDQWLTSLRARLRFQRNSCVCWCVFLVTVFSQLYNAACFGFFSLFAACWTVAVDLTSLHREVDRSLWEGPAQMAFRWLGMKKIWITWSP